MNIDTDDCWLAAQSIGNNGYARVYERFVNDEGNVTRKQLLLHRLMYELYKGPIPYGLAIDHLCNIRRCINPDHLEAVTTRENNLRMFKRNNSDNFCRRGHLRSAINTKRTNTGHLRCIDCYKISKQKFTSGDKFKNYMARPDVKERILASKRKYDEKRRKLNKK